MNSLKTFFANKSRPAEHDAVRSEPANRSSAGRPNTLERRANAVDVDKISICLAKVEIALNHGNQEEAAEAIKAAFQVETTEPVTRESPITDLGLDILICNLLERRALFTVGDLTMVTYTELRAITNFGQGRIEQVRTALERHGFALAPCTIFRPLELPDVVAMGRGD